MENQTLKLYGLSQQEVEQELRDIIEKYKDSCKIKIKEKYLDISLDISSESSDNTNAVIKQIFDKLSKYIYSESNQTLYERLADLLIVRNKKLCLMEQATGGVITANLMAIDDADKHIISSTVLPSTESWLTTFDIDPRLLRENKGISSKLVFSIASSLRGKILADYYIVALSSDAIGLDVYTIGENRVEENSLIAIGDNTGVEIYKHVLSGSKRDRMNQTAKFICSKLIFELKK